jgi:hypothetical protein
MTDLIDEGLHEAPFVANPDYSHDYIGLSLASLGIPFQNNIDSIRGPLPAHRRAKEALPPNG